MNLSSLLPYHVVTVFSLHILDGHSATDTSYIYYVYLSPGYIVMWEGLVDFPEMFVFQNRPRYQNNTNAYRESKKEKKERGTGLPCTHDTKGLSTTCSFILVVIARAIVSQVTCGPAILLTKCFHVFRLYSLVFSFVIDFFCLVARFFFFFSSINRNKEKRFNKLALIFVLLLNFALDIFFFYLKTENAICTKFGRLSKISWTYGKTLNYLNHPK